MAGGEWTEAGECEEVKTMTEELAAPTGKEIRLTEYAACAG